MYSNHAATAATASWAGGGGDAEEGLTMDGRANFHCRDSPPEDGSGGLGAFMVGVLEAPILEAADPDPGEELEVDFPPRDPPPGIPPFPSDIGVLTF